MASSSIKRKIDSSNNNAVDIFANELAVVSAGLENVTGNYVISKGDDLSNPYFTIDTGNGDVTIANNLVVKGTTTISNTSSVNLETTNLSVGLKNNTMIDNVKQVSNINYTNYQQYANIFLTSTYPFLLNSNIKFNGLTANVGGSSRDYSIVYSTSLFTNVYNNVNLVSNNAKNNNNNNFGFTDNTSPIFNQTSFMTDSSFYFKSNFPVHLAATLTSSINSSSTNINVNNTNGWDNSGYILIAPDSATTTVTSGVIVDSTSTNASLTVLDGSLFTVNDYVAGTNNNGDLFVLGKIINIVTNTLTFNTYIPGTIIANSNVYKLYKIVYTSKTRDAFEVSSLSSLGANTITPSSSNYLQVFSEKSIIGSSNLYYFNNSVSVSAPYVISISTTENDTEQDYCPIFDNSPPDISLIGNQFFTLHFDSTILTPTSTAFTSNPISVGELQSNTTNDGLFSLDFNFTDSANNNATKSICIGSNGASSTPQTDSVYFTKMVNDSPATFFSFDYSNHKMQFKNGANIQNNVANQLLLNASTSTTVTSATNSTSKTTGSLIVAGGMGINNDVYIGGNENVSGLLNVTNSTESSTSSNGALVISGGLGIAKNTNIAGVLKVSNNTTSSSYTTGAMVISGGVGIGGTVNINGDENVTGLLKVTNTAVSTNATSGAMVISGGVGIGGTVNIAGNENIEGLLNVTNSTESSTSSNGAVIISGGLGIAKNTNIAGQLKVTSSTASTNASTGAMVITGGIGIGGAVYIAGNENVAGILKVTDTTVSTNASTGAMVITGGVGIGGSVNITGNENVAGLLNVTNSTESSSSSNGAVVILGGVGIAKNTNIAGELKVTASTDSTNASTGALVITGGVGIGGTVNIAGNENVTGLLKVTNTAVSTDATSGAMVISGGVGIGGAVNITGNENVAGLLNVTNSTESSTSSNGAVVILGGLGIAKNTNIAGVLKVTDTTASTNATSGAMVISGGVGIGGVVNITGNENVAGVLKVTDTTVSTNATSGAMVISGGAGIGGNLNVGGDFTLSGAQTTTSDQTLKTDIVPIDNALDKVLNMNGVYFNWIDKEKFNDRHQIGFLAQNVESVIPELVLTDNSGIKSVNYSQLVAVLVEAFKEQNNVINQLKTDVELLKQKKTRTKKTISTTDCENNTN